MGIKKELVICRRKNKNSELRRQGRSKKYVTEIIAENVNLLDKKEVV